MVACALTRQVPAGSEEGRKTVKVRPAFTLSQLVIVVGVPGPLVGVGVTAVALAVAVGVAPEAEVGVALAVAVGSAPSSRKSIDGLLHQCRSASVGAVAVGAAVFPVPPLLPPKGFVQDASSITK